MAGHSKFANTKHRKAAVDAKRAVAFTKLARLITVAARKGGDPEMNASLRLVVDKAKVVNMPKDRIERAIQKGVGGGEDSHYDALFYEGYAQAGVAIFAEALTDNRNRTTPEIRKVFEKAGGNMGEVGCVAWMFQHKGVILLENIPRSEEEMMELAIEIGADDIQFDGGDAQLVTQFESFEGVLKGLRAAGIEPSQSELSYVAENRIVVDEQNARKILRLMGALDDHDDIQNVYSNMEIPPEVQEKLDA